MITSRKTLITTAVVVAALFVIAAPLGDAHHGIGQHNKFVAVLGQTLFITFLIGAVVLIALTATALARAAWSHHASN